MPLNIWKSRIIRPLLINWFRDRIIPEISIDKIDPSDCIWIPHRLLIKINPLTVTNERPVLNCSLKVRGKTFLNEAALTGVDIMEKLVDLLNYFQTLLSLSHYSLWVCIFLVFSKFYPAKIMRREFTTLRWEPLFRTSFIWTTWPIVQTRLPG